MSHGSCFPSIMFTQCVCGYCSHGFRQDSDQQSCSRETAWRFERIKSHVSIRQPHWQQSRMLQPSPDIQPVSGSTQNSLSHRVHEPTAHSHRLFDEAYLKRMCNISGFKIQHVCDSLAVWSLFRWRSSKASPALSKTPEARAEELRCQYLLCQRWASPPERFLWWVCLQ